jgi:hypothetical protein
MHRHIAILSILGLACLALGASGCKGKDAAKCQEAQDGVRKSAAAGDEALLTQWRNYAYKYCEDSTALGALDQEIAQKKAADAKAKAEALRKQQESDQLVALFVKWAGENRAAPDRSGATVSCDGGEAEEKSQERWCARTRRAGSYTLSARYWDKDRTAVKFDTVIPQPITCEKLGAARIIRSWTIPNQQVKRSHCEITAGALAGMQAMVSEASNAPLHVFTPAYLERDPALKRKLSTEGM